MKFNRSEYMKERHFLAKQQREYIEKINNKKHNYSDFLKSDNLFTQNIVMYDVSYQVTYVGEVDNFIIAKSTFRVTAFENQYSEIYNKTMNMILDSKGKMTNNNLSTNTIDMLKDNTDIKVTPRGMERSNKKLTNEDIRKVLSNQYIVEDIDKDIKFTNKKKRTGELKFDLRHFN